MRAIPFPTDRPTLGRGLVLLATCAWLAGCDSAGQSVDPGKPLAAVPGNGIADDVADLADDALQAPLAPTLSISAAPGTLSFSWTGIPEGTVATLYRRDDHADVEDVVQLLDPTDDSLTLDVSALALDWLHSHYRVAWCDAFDCVSSRYTAIEPLLPQAIQVLDAASATSGWTGNANGRLLVRYGADHEALELQLFSGDGSGELSRHAQSIALDWPLSAPDAPLAHAVASDASGDTLVALRHGTGAALQLVSVQRLGETWIRTADLSVDVPQQIATRLDEGRPMTLRSGDTQSIPVTADGDVRVTARFAGDGNSLLVSVFASDGHVGRLSLLTFVRNGFEWLLASHRQLSPGARWLPTLTASDDLGTVFLAERRASGVHVQRLPLIGDDGTPVDTGIVLDTADDRVALLTDTRARSLVVAQLDTIGATATPTLYRYVATDAGDGSPRGSWLAGDSWRGPTRLDGADAIALQLAGDATLSRIVVGMQAGNDTTLTVLQAEPLGWRDTLALPVSIREADPTLLRPPPALPPVSGIPWISRDGTLLLAGELLIR